MSSKYQDSQEAFKVCLYEARLLRKSDGDKVQLASHLNAMMENRNSLLVDFRFTEANPRAERDAPVEMLEQGFPGSKRLPLAADKAFSTRKFVALCRMLIVVPHVAATPRAKANRP